MKEITWLGTWGFIVSSASFLWQAVFKEVRLVVLVTIVILSLLVGFFVGKHFPTIGSAEAKIAAAGEIKNPAVASKPSSATIVRIKKQPKVAPEPEDVKADDPEIRAKIDAEKAKINVAENGSRIESVGLVKTTVQKTVSVKAKRRDQLVVKKKMFAFYNKDGDFPLKYELYLPGEKFPVEEAQKCSAGFAICPVTFENTAILLRAFMDEGPYQDSPDFLKKRGFTEKDTPVLLIYENGKITVTKDFSILPNVTLLNPDGTPWSYKGEE